MTVTVEPQVTYYSWWPASVLLPKVPGERRQQVLHTCRVYATDAGLFVYRRPVPDSQPDFHAIIDYSTTNKPPNSLPHYAHDVHTDAGLVVVTATGGCGCGNPVKSWRPSFSSRVGAWPV
jgi:hypothetical protein